MQKIQNIQLKSYQESKEQQNTDQNSFYHMKLNNRICQLLKNPKILFSILIILIIFCSLIFVFIAQKPEQKPLKPLYIPTYQQLQKLNPKQDVIIVTLAGRKKYLEILYKYLKRQLDSFKTWNLWLHTKNQQDIQFMYKLARQNSWIKVIVLSDQILKQQKDPYKYAIRLWRFDYQPKKIYIRFDDDMIWLQQNFIKQMFKSRYYLINHFLVYPNVINHCWTAWLQNSLNVYKNDYFPNADYIGNYYNTAGMGIQYHNQFLQSIKKNQTNKWRSFKQWMLVDYGRYNINSLMYYSQTIQSVQQMPRQFDQQLLFAVLYPLKYKFPCVILGNILTSHCAYNTQRTQLPNQYKEIQQKYKKISQQL